MGERLLPVACVGVIDEAVEVAIMAFVEAEGDMQIKAVDF